MNAIGSFVDSLVGSATRAVERLPIPDAMTLAGISLLVERTARKTSDRWISPESVDRGFAEDMARFPIAVHTDLSKEQHYEVPARFFELMLGPRRKYSCGFYEPATGTAEGGLANAEEAALARSCAHADLMDGQRILELGCGWGSLTLWMAQHYPHASITAVSHSRSQREYIVDQLAVNALTNVQVLTADMNDFDVPVDMPRFDRVVSIEMFEHMANWRALLSNVRRWLTPEGKLFLHVFSNQGAPYRFDHHDPADWIAQHFFTGGIMPSHTMIAQFADLFAVEKQWRWDGTHYERTARDWLDNFDRHSAEIDVVLAEVYGSDSALWKRRWRLFLLATIGLFGHHEGGQWGVSHYRLSPVPERR